MGVNPFSRYDFWQEREDSNPQPPVLETGALPVELRSCMVPLELSVLIATKLKIGLQAVILPHCAG